MYVPDELFTHGKKGGKDHGNIDMRCADSSQRIPSAAQLMCSAKVPKPINPPLSVQFDAETHPLCRGDGKGKYLHQTHVLRDEMLEGA